MTRASSSCGALLLGALLVASCAGAPAWKNVPHDRLYQRVPQSVLHPYPGEDPFHSTTWDHIYQSTLRPLGEVLSPGTYVDVAAGTSDALDINAFGNVVDSAWFTNRMGRHELTPDDVRRGPDTLEGGPAPGVLTVIAGKVEGAAPGLVVRDSEGVEFVVKFDPPAYPELSSGAEVIATKLLWAAGYNVPENYVVTFALERLRLAPEATTSGEYGVPVRLTEERLTEVIWHANPTPSGEVRALFSRVIPGLEVGPFSYRGVRGDDPNDHIRHEDRRSLRGLWLFSAWLNNTDTSASNTLDTFILHPGEEELGTLRHFLIDFGDALGADALAPKYMGQGYEYALDWVQLGKAVFSAGMYYSYWLPVRRSPYRSVGIFEAEVFEPAYWRPIFRNPAFDRSNPRDDYWAAAILARFDERHIAAAVDAADYSEPGAARWVRQVLMERRRLLLTHAFARVLPLDDPRVEGQTFVTLEDLAVKTGLATRAPGAYRFTVRWNRTGDAAVPAGAGTSDEPTADLAPALDWLRRAHREAFDADPFLTLRWSLAEGGSAVEVHLRAVGGALLPVGLEREVE